MSDFEHNAPIRLYSVHVTGMDQACAKLWLYLILIICVQDLDYELRKYL